MKLKVFEAFAGYGGASFGLQNSGLDFEVIGFSEIDKYANEILSINFPSIPNYGDITQINPSDLPDFSFWRQQWHPSSGHTLPAVRCGGSRNSLPRRI